MFIKHCHPDDTPFVTKKYQLLEATEMVMQMPDGRQVLHGFGVGEVLEVMEPRVINLVYTTEQKQFIELADGSRIVSWPRPVKTVML
jgi:hypothetical protein